MKAKHKFRIITEGEAFSNTSLTKEGNPMSNKSSEFAEQAEAEKNESQKGTEIQGRLICTPPLGPCAVIRARCTVVPSKNPLDHTRTTCGSHCPAGESREVPCRQKTILLQQVPCFAMSHLLQTTSCYSVLYVERFTCRTFMDKRGFWKEAWFFYYCSGLQALSVAFTRGNRVWGLSWRCARRWDWKKVKGSGMGNAVLNQKHFKKWLFSDISISL